jgi:hypothetical protein
MYWSRWFLIVVHCLSYIIVADIYAMKRLREDAECNELEPLFDCLSDDFFINNIEDDFPSYEHGDKHVEPEKTEILIPSLPKADVIDRESFVCSLCNIGFLTSKRLSLHNNKKHRKKIKWHCEDCDGSFDSKNDLDVHVKVMHKYQEVYRCDQCDKIFNTPSQRKSHQIIHQQSTKECCPTCGKKVKYLRSHVKLHQIPEIFCIKCGQGFVRTYFLKRHATMCPKKELTF